MQYKRNKRNCLYKIKKLVMTNNDVILVLYNLSPLDKLFPTAGMLYL